MRSIGVVHPGTQHSWQTARALEACNELAWYATSIYWLPNQLPYSLAKFLPSKLRQKVEREFSRFQHPDLDPARVRAFNGTEWLRRVAGRLRWHYAYRVLMERSNRGLGGPVSRLIKREPVSAVWGYDTVALEVFQTAKARGVKTILDRTIGHPAAYNKIMTSVYDTYADFFSSRDFLIPDDVIERVDAEHSLADLILVGSEFCASTLRRGPARVVANDKLRLVPYCYDDVFFGRFAPKIERSNKPVRFLFTGQAGPRKGFHLVLKVFEKIPKSAATLVVVGDMQIPPDVVARYADRFEYHPTVPRAEVAKFMQQCDCLLLPSYFEGAGLVLYEAGAIGMAVIHSSNTDQFLDPDSPGVMEKLDETSLLKCVMTFIDAPDILFSERERNIAAAANYTFKNYQSRVAQIAQLIVANAAV